MFTNTELEEHKKSVAKSWDTYDNSQKRERLYSLLKYRILAGADLSRTGIIDTSDVEEEYYR